MHVGSTDWNRNPRVLLSDAAATSMIFYKAGRWDFTVPPCTSAAATATATPDEDDDGGGGLKGMMAVGTTTACITGAFLECVGGGSGSIVGRD